MYDISNCCVIFFIPSDLFKADVKALFKMSTMSRRIKNVRNKFGRFKRTVLNVQVVLTGRKKLGKLLLEQWRFKYGQNYILWNMLSGVMN